jgi:uncharacterized protein (DUF1684 family)
VAVARLIPLALLVLLSAACTPKEVPYAEEIAAWRAEKDAFMQGSSRSPVPREQRAAFQPLNYFPVDESYRVPAELALVPSTEIIEMDTSDGKKRRMRRIGRLEFMLKGQPLTLTAFADASENDMSRLFVPFGDLTAGTETYPGGRYLDLDRTATGLYDLDFNRAYHPFCVYNPEYVCPLPPKENRLTVPIRAGEKL